MFQHILENIEISNFKPVLLLGGESFHANGGTNRRTDIKKYVVAFSNFVNVPRSFMKICLPYSKYIRRGLK